jgi:hypothetical protein
LAAAAAIPIVGVADSRLFDGSARVPDRSGYRLTERLARIVENVDSVSTVKSASSQGRFFF